MKCEKRCESGVTQLRIRAPGGEIIIESGEVIFESGESVSNPVTSGSNLAKSAESEHNSRLEPGP